MAGLIIDLDNYVFAEILQRDLGPQVGAEIPYFVGPFFKFGIVGDAAFQGDGFVFAFPGRFS